MYKKVVVIIAALISISTIDARPSTRSRRPIKEVSVISEEKISHYNINMFGVPFGKDFQAQGSCYLRDFRTKKMEIKGNAAIEDSIISDETRVSGELAAHKTTFGGLVDVGGPAAASTSRFKDTLVVNGEVLLINTIIGQDLIIENTLGQSGQVYLQGKTIIYGSVVFKSGAGRIYSNRKSKIHGTIVGGTMFKQ